jgi:hypothetical protein
MKPLLELLLRGKDSRFGKRLKHVPLLRAVLLFGWIWVQRRVFARGLLTLETNLRETRGTGTENSAAPRLQGGASNSTRMAGDEFSRILSQFSTSKLHLLGYQYVYGPLLLPHRGERVRLLEIGVGTNDPSAPSSMGPDHIPGTSLRAWRTLFPEGAIYGADVDERILLHEDGIECFWVDQRNPASIRALLAKIGGDLDVIIDDGLHTPEAAINSMSILLPALRPGGMYVLEDALERFDSGWRKAEEALEPWFDMTYYPTRVLNQFRVPREAGLLLAIRRDRQPA